MKTLQLRGLEALLLSDFFGQRTKTLVPTSTRLRVPEAVHGVPHKLKERKAKQAYYYDRVAKELDRLKHGDVVCVKLRPDLREWTKLLLIRKLILGRISVVQSMAIHTGGIAEISSTPGSHS